MYGIFRIRTIIYVYFRGKFFINVHDIEHPIPN
jgi:hypothetical protein